MKTSKASEVLWGNANKRTNAQNGMGPAADAKHEILTVKQLIRQIGTNSAALALLAERQHELTPAQRTAALEAFNAAAPKARKVTKAAPPAPSRLLSRTLARVGLYGKSGTGAPS